MGDAVFCAHVVAFLLARSFEYTSDLSAGQFTRTGPDGVETFVQLDTAGRVQSFRRGPAQDPIMTAAYTYYADGQVDTVSYGNGTTVTYAYDDARRLISIAHRDPLSHLMRALAYSYLNNDLPYQVIELTSSGPVATVTYEYDDRGRLIGETRTGEDAYELAYTYDQGGNRLTKTDVGNDVLSEYTYDIDDPTTYGSANNRLMLTETFDTSGQEPVLDSTTWYYYSVYGNVTRTVTNEAGTDDYTATRFVYATNGQAVWYVMGESWEWDGDDEHAVTAYDIAYLREFRYDGPTERYLNRELDADEFLSSGDLVEVSAMWSDYSGGEIYGDFEVESGAQSSTVYERRSFELGLAKVDTWASAGDGYTKYYHADMLGTTRFLTDRNGTASGAATYTAFGERVSGTLERYGFGGAFGFEGFANVPYLLGAMAFYDPPSGSLQDPGFYEAAGGLGRDRRRITGPDDGVDRSSLLPLRPSGPLPEFPHYKPKWEPARPHPRKPPNGLTPGQELERVKKKVWIGHVGLAIVCGGLGAMVGGPWGAALGVALAVTPGVIDTGRYWDEPLNPAFGGDYDNWYPDR